MKNLETWRTDSGVDSYADSSYSILITGGTIGLGYQAALEIAKQRPQYHMVLCSRTDPENAPASIKAATGHGNVTFRKLDLANLASVRQFVTDYTSEGLPPIGILLLNAGVQLTAAKVTYTDDGIETTFAINHVGHALLFNLLRPNLAKDCRIVVTASGTHDPAQKSAVPDAAYNTAEELANPTAESAKNAGRQRYATSKLCNIMWMYALHKRLSVSNPEHAWTVMALDPGLMPGTALARDSPAPVLFIWNHILPRIIPFLRFVFGKHNIHSPRESGHALAKLALDDAAEGGKYWEGTQIIKSSDMSYDTTKQEDLWKWTNDRVAVNAQEKRDFEAVY